MGSAEQRQEQRTNDQFCRLDSMLNALLTHTWHVDKTSLSVRCSEFTSLSLTADKTDLYSSG